jgi:hypothetical protein
MDDRNTYLAFTPDTPQELAIEVFRRRFGSPPEKVFIMYPHRLLVAGPVNIPPHQSAAGEESARIPEFMGHAAMASPSARPR